MKLVLETDSRIHTVRSYRVGEIIIGEQRLTAPFIVSPAQLIADWQVESLRSLNLAQLQPLLALQPRIVLLGSPGSNEFAPASLRRTLEARGIALECMELGAACRTYNVLAQEGRLVAAGFIPSPADPGAG
jgi:uncharacterized protein